MSATCTIPAVQGEPSGPSEIMSYTSSTRWSHGHTTLFWMPLDLKLASIDTTATDDIFDTQAGIAVFRPTPYSSSHSPSFQLHHPSLEFREEEISITLGKNDSGNV